MPTIEVSTELFGRLQELAVPFGDRSPEDVLWRLVRGSRESIRPSSVSEPAVADHEGLLSSGVLIPNGLALRFSFKGKVVPGEVRDGRIWIGSMGYASPSAAAQAAAESVGFPKRSLNGWVHWEFHDQGKWQRLLVLRKAADVRRRARARGDNSGSTQ